MKLSYNWLKELVKFDLKPEELANVLTNQGLETGIASQTGAWTNVVTAKVLQTEKHPNADKLRLCTLTDGTAQYSLVCGAANVAAGQTVALAKLGAVLPGDFKIERRKIRGVESEGMICSEKELGMAEESEGIMVLPEGTPLGRLLEELTGGVDTILNVEITTNRADCLSHWGIAREIAAHVRENVKLPDIHTHAVTESVPVSIVETQLCRRYIGYRITGVKVGPSPDWMVRRLRNCGFRSVNNIVDITNFVMIELGHPLHAFDIDCLNGRKIIVRRAKDGEKIKALDSKEYTLNDSILVIADDNKPVAIAGVMGGETCGISDKTATVLLESAVFNPVVIRRASKKLNISSESSYRFERSVSWDGAELAARRAADLMIRLAGGTIEAITDEIASPDVKTIVKLRHSRVKALLGLDIPLDVCKEILSCLGLRVSEAAGTITATIPSWRHDLSQEVDLIEEVARVYGYSNIPANVLAHIPENIHISCAESLETKLRRSLASKGYFEAMNYSFTSEAQVTRYGLAVSHKLSNPLSRDHEAMRPSLISGLMTNFEHNRALGHRSVKLFETGRTFSATGERSVLGLLAYGNIWPEWWKYESSRIAIPSADYYYLAGIITSLFNGNKVEFMTTDKVVPYLHPGKSAEVAINGNTVGHLGVVHPAYCKEQDQEIIYAELDMDKIRNAVTTGTVKYAPIKRFPPVKRDLSLIAEKSLSFDKVLSFIEKAKRNSVTLEDARLFSVFEGEKIGADKISYALHLTFRHAEHTLADVEINSEVERLLNGLKADLGITLRT